MRILKIERKGPILKSPSFECLREIPSINVTAGCLHGCLYCYAFGFQSTPKDGTVLLYQNIPKLLLTELNRKKVLPSLVSFSTASDPFQKDEEILSTTFETMEILLKKGISISFLTKGFIPPFFIELFKRFRDSIKARIGIVSLKEEYRRVFEPNTATIDERLKNIENLIDAGVETNVRIDPLIPVFTDQKEDLERLFLSLKERGIRKVSVSFLIMRPYLYRRLSEGLGREKSKKIFSFFENEPWQRVITSAKTRLLPKDYREKKIYSIKRLAERHGISCSVCGCKNPDLPFEYCLPFRFSPLPIFRS